MSSDKENGLSKVVKLNGNNYHEWKDDIKMILIVTAYQTLTTQNNDLCQQVQNLRDEQQVALDTADTNQEDITRLRADLTAVQAELTDARSIATALSRAAPRGSREKMAQDHMVGTRSYEVVTTLATQLDKAIQAQLMFNKPKSTSYNLTMSSQFNAEFPPPSGQPAQPSPTPPNRPSTPVGKITELKNKAWDKSDVERLVAWMEDNQEKLRGKQSAWHKDVKEEIFKDDDDMTIKRIREKAVNIKTSWTKTKAVLVKTGWGLRPEKNEASINDTLES
ncbi:hypothetical protein BGX38DRAFT_1331077 [Terfezia claveryi]|nr:hypothetical protein BGX38DRAFT_1331077 [Terfezia claveryi]